jgi:transcriptional regulator with XRE-family HTH domain
MERGRIPNSLKRYRRLAGLSQKRVALTLGLQQATLSRWEKGMALPGIRYLFQLSLLYRALPNDLYSDLWQVLKHEAFEHNEKLLAEEEAFISNETYYL